MPRLRHKKNMIQGGVTALVRYFAEHDYSMQYPFQAILLQAFEWDNEERETKLPNYIARIHRIENLFSILPLSRVDLANAIELNDELVSECIDILKEHGYITQFGGGYGRILILSGTKIEIPDLDDFVIHLDDVQVNDAQELENPGRNAQHNEFINWAMLQNQETKQQIRILADGFREVAEKLETMDFADQEEIERQQETIDDYEKLHQELRQELELVKRTSWR